jgi:hypothetical protein
LTEIIGPDGRSGAVVGIVVSCALQSILVGHLGVLKWIYKSVAISDVCLWVDL